MRKILLLIFAFSVQGCTVAHFNHHGFLESSPGNALGNNCKISYFLEVEGFHENQKSKISNEYDNSVKKVVSDLGCHSIKLSAANESSLLIKVKTKGFGGAAAQEFLTGLSFGLVPSWCTREAMYTYEISNGATKKIYTLDHVSYNHLVLFPFIWVNFLADSEQEHFRILLTNFIENT